MLMRTIAVELAPHNITVNNIAPGAVDTPMDAPLEEDANKMKQLLSEIPPEDGKAGRGGSPGRVPGLRRRRLCDGSTFVIDGGMMRSSGRL